MSSADEEDANSEEEAGLDCYPVCTIVLGCFSGFSVRFQAQISCPYPCTCPGLKERLEADEYRPCAVHFLGL